MHATEHAFSSIIVLYTKNQEVENVDEKLTQTQNAKGVGIRLRHPLLDVSGEFLGHRITNLSWVHDLIINHVASNLIST